MSFLCTGWLKHWRRKERSNMERPPDVIVDMERPTPYNILSNMERLTTDLIMDILSRLPIRSILRAKCVCKSWLIITSDQAFYKLHLVHRPSTRSGAVILTFSDSQSWKKLFLAEEFFTKQIDISFINGLKDQCPYILGGCNGLLCISVSPQIMHEGTLVLFKGLLNPIYILNPITGESHQLPNFEAFVCQPTTAKYGFGFDDSRKVFKVVVFLHNAFMDEMHVYTIGVGSNNTWRKQVGNVPKVFFHSLQKILDSFVNGSLHLITSDNSAMCRSSRSIILSFNLGLESFEVIQIPESIAVKPIYCAPWECLTLGVVNDCLSLVDVGDENWKLVEIWLRKKECGTMSWSWIKHFSFYQEFIVPIPIASIKLISCQQNMELLLMGPNFLVVYNVEDNTSKFVEIGELDNPEGLYGFQVIPFEGSLISIDASA